MSRARAHHYVPQVYLRRWVGEEGRVAVRRRGSDQVFIASPKRVAQETDLYTIEDVDGPSDMIETHLSQFEGHLPDVLDAMMQGRIPEPGTPGRTLFAGLLALQFVRTPDRMEDYRFPGDSLIAANGQHPVPREVISALLEERWGYSPTESQVQGTWDWVNLRLQEHMRVPPVEYWLALFQAMPEVAGVLESKRWSVEVSKGQSFFTSDQPLTLWMKRPNRLRGSGIVDADEIRFPVGPRHLLVLRPRGVEAKLFVPRSRVDAVNCHVAATCRHMVIGQCRDVPAIQRVPLRDRRPMWKIDGGPLYQSGPDGDTYEGDVIQLYRPYDDRPDEEYPCSNDL